MKADKLKAELLQSLMKLRTQSEEFHHLGILPYEFPPIVLSNAELKGLKTRRRTAQKLNPMKP